jgi:hypothetical protein
MASRSGGEAPVHSRYFQAAEFPLIFGCCSDVNSLIVRRILLINTNALKHGRYTAEAIARRRQLSELIRMARVTLAELKERR